MKHIGSAFFIALALLLGSNAYGQGLSFQENEPVQITVGSIPAGYTTYWVSDIDGYIGQGNSLNRILSVGAHTVSAYIYQNSTSQLVWSGSIGVQVLSAAPAPVVTAAPTSSGNTYAPAEFDPVDELLLGCPDVYMVDDLYPAFLDALRGVVKTTIYVDNSWVRNDLEDLFWQTGVDNTDYTIVQAPIDTIWMRDYGPLFVKDQGSLEVVDIEYYPGRDNDDAFPRRFAQERGLRARDLPLAWEGGNYTSDGRGGIYATQILYDYNNYSPSSIDRAVTDDFEADELYIFDPMLDDGGTGHLDMFFSMTGPYSVLINKFPSWHQNYDRMERHTSRLRQMGFSVERLALADTRYSSHSNALFVNGIALVPTYNNPSTDAAALQAYRNAGFTAVGIDCRRIIQWAGAIHCITITVPR